MKQLWEILVPTVRNDGRPFRLRYHRIWDAKVREISGGLTILPVAKGQWVYRSPNNPAEAQLFKERTIPVRIMATEEEINSIVDFTLKYYDQIAVMAYRIADEVILRYRK